MEKIKEGYESDVVISSPHNSDLKLVLLDIALVSYLLLFLRLVLLFASPLRAVSMEKSHPHCQHLVKCCWPYLQTHLAPSLHLHVLHLHCYRVFLQRLPFAIHPPSCPLLCLPCLALPLLTTQPLPLSDILCRLSDILLAAPLQMIVTTLAQPRSHAWHWAVLKAVMVPHLYQRLSNTLCVCVYACMSVCMCGCVWCVVSHLFSLYVTG